jgi:hypothetical protein
MSVIVRTSEGKELARYSDEIPVAHVPEGSIQSIEVEKAACGASSCSLIWITLKPGELLQELKSAEREVGAVEWVEPKWDSSLIAKRRAYELERARSTVARMDTLVSALERFREVPVVVQPGAGQLDTEVLRNKVAPMLEQARILLRDTTRRPVIVRRAEGVSRVMPSILLVSSTGAVLREMAGDVTRIRASSAVDDIKPDDIAEIEVYKGSACPTTATVGCPLIKITLKPGREAAYRKR